MQACVSPGWDTPWTMLALLEAGTKSTRSFYDGLEWMIGMQNADGGWTAFDRENNTKLVEKIPLCDFGEVLDTSSADVTAHVL